MSIPTGTAAFTARRIRVGRSVPGMAGRPGPEKAPVSNSPPRPSGSKLPEAPRSGPRGKSLLKDPPVPTAGAAVPSSSTAAPRPGSRAPSGPAVTERPVAAAAAAEAAAAEDPAVVAVAGVSSTYIYEFFVGKEMSIIMVIRVIYRDQTYDMVKSTRLDDLIMSGKIEKFQRSAGWVNVDEASLRGSKENLFIGPERRSMETVIV